MTKKRSFATAIGLCVLLAGAPSVEACTSLRLMTTNGYPIYGRTMEFASATIAWQLAIYPRGVTFTGLAPDGETGLSWTGKYGFVGALGGKIKDGAVSDGMNEKGLVVGLLILYGSKYQVPNDEADIKKTIAYWQLGNYILSNFATVGEVKKALADDVLVANIPLPSSLGLPSLPVHFAVHDADGNALVIEYIDHQLHIYDNPLGVLTNDPSFEWQMENLTFLHRSAARSASARQTHE